MNYIKTCHGYDLFGGDAIACQKIVYQYLQDKLLGMWAICLCVDSGPGGWDEWGEMIGDHNQGKVTAKMLKEWPTYWDAYDEWYLLDEQPGETGELDTLVNYQCEIHSQIDALNFDGGVDLWGQIKRLNARYAFGNNESYSYMVAPEGELRI